VTQTETCTVDVYSWLQHQWQSFTNTLWVTVGLKSLLRSVPPNNFISDAPLDTGSARVPYFGVASVACDLRYTLT
jgi:hypothetical protein